MVTNLFFILVYSLVSLENFIFVEIVVYKFLNLVINSYVFCGSPLIVFGIIDVGFFINGKLITYLSKTSLSGANVIATNCASITKLPFSALNSDVYLTPKMVILKLMHNLS